MYYEIIIIVADFGRRLKHVPKLLSQASAGIIIVAVGIENSIVQKSKVGIPKNKFRVFKNVGT